MIIIKRMEEITRQRKTIRTDAKTEKRSFPVPTPLYVQTSIDNTYQPKKFQGKRSLKK